MKVTLTNEGKDHLQTAFGASSIYPSEIKDIANMAIQCLKALHLLKKVETMTSSTKQ